MAIDVEISVNKTNVTVNTPVANDVGIDTPFELTPHRLGDHTDTAGALTAIANQYLKFDGTDWVPATPDWMTTNHPANGITNTKIANWDTAFGWGNHASAGYAIRANNLSDLSSAATARTNLGFPTVNTNQVLFGAANNLYQQNANFVFDGSSLIIGHTTAAATLHARGSSATVGDAILIQNGGASPATRFRVGNDGTTNLCNPNVQLTYSSSILTFTLIGGGGVAINPANTLSNALSQAFNIQSSGVSAAASVATRQLMVGISDTRSSGASRYSGVEINGTINQTGTATGIVSALYINGTVTNANDFRAIEVTSGKVLLNGVNKHSYLVTHRLSDTERNALTNLVAGAIIFNTTAGKHQGYDGTNWNNLW